MKRINKLLLSCLMLGVAVFTTSCEEEEFFFKGPNFVAFDTSAASVREDATAPMNITIGASTPGGVKQDVTVTYEVSGNAVEGVDYRLNTPKTVTIPAGKNNASIVIEPINNSQFDPARTITLTIKSVSDPSLNVGINETEKKQHSVNVSILNDDCPVNTALWHGSVSILRVGTGTTFSSVLSANDAGDCNVLHIRTNAFAINANAQIARINLIPQSAGARSGTVVMPKQNTGLRFGAPHGVLTFEGTGTYDEESKKMTINVIGKMEDGTVFREDTYVFTGN